MDWKNLQSVAIKNNLAIAEISFLLKNTTFVFDELNFRSHFYDHSTKTYVKLYLISVRYLIHCMMIVEVNYHQQIICTL